MALLLNLKKISIKRKYTVCGFIRRLEKEMDMMPKEIIDLFVLFYGNGSDEWDPELLSTDHVTLDEDNRMVSSLKNKCSDGNAYMKRIVEFGYHEWKLKVKYGTTTSGHLMIGLWRIQNKKTPPLRSYYTDGKEKGYGFACSQGKLVNPKHGYGFYNDYGVSVTDSIIDMIVDFDNLSLSFKIDGKDYGKAFDITQDKYRAAVYFYGNGTNSVQILE